MKAVSLFSGGLDSTLASLIARQEGLDVDLLYIDYGQYQIKAEWSAAIKVARNLDFCTPYRIDIPFFRNVGLMRGRSLALIGLATMFAFKRGLHRYSHIIMGTHQGDIAPDCKPGNFDIMAKGALEECTDSGLTLWLPIQKCNSKEIGLALKEWDAPFDLMYSCYWDPPCGYKSTKDQYRCPGCLRRASAMMAAGHPIPDIETEGDKYEPRR